MQPSVIIKSKTIDEAIQTALTILHASVDEVEIAIVKSPSKHLFGLRKQLAEVKVTKVSDPHPPVNQAINQFKDLDEAEMKAIIKDVVDPKAEGSRTPPFEHTQQKHLKEQSGIWIQDGVVHVQATPPLYPILIIGKNVKVSINGKPVHSKQVVTTNDTIDVQIVDEIIPPQYSIKLLEGNMKALLTLTPGKKIHRKLLDTKPSEELTIEAVENIISFNDLTFNQLLVDLQELQVSEGIDYQAITRAVASLEDTETIIAAGVEPVQGKNGELMVLYDNAIFNSVKVQHNKVDYREQNQIANVKAGQIIAKVIPPQEGKPGKDLFGQIVHPNPVLPVDLRPSKHIVVKNDEIIAQDSGRPSIQRRGRLVKIDIVQEWIHYGDLTIDTGNIHFNGDVRIKGDVMDSMTIEAEGVVVVEGTVTKANVQSAESVQIGKNVFSSKINVGKANHVIGELLLLLQSIIEQLDKIDRALQQLLIVSQITDDTIPNGQLNYLIRLLTERKYNGIRDMIQLFYQKIKMNLDLLDDDWLKVATNLNNQFIILSNENMNKLSSFHQMIDHTKEVYEIYCVPPEPKSKLSLPYAINSELYCSGNIFVTGKGSYHSQIQAGNNVKISGVCRGGEIVAGRNVTLEEAGSDIGVKTFIRVPVDGSILIRHVHAGTVIQIGNRIHTFAVEEMNIKARMNDNGMIEIR